MSDQALNIILGAALAAGYPKMFNEAKQQLNEPLSLSYDQADERRNLTSHNLLEIALQGAIVSNKDEMVSCIMKYGKYRNYLLCVPGFLVKMHMKETLSVEKGFFEGPAICMYRNLTSGQVLIHHEEPLERSDKPIMDPSTPIALSQD